MFDSKLSINSLLKKTKDLISLKIFKETLKNLKDKCIIIVDNRGSYFLNNFFTLTEVIDFGIISVESIYFKRKPYPKHEAIYVISACDKSINHIYDDFIKEQPALYKSCHIFTLDEIDENIMNLIIQKKEKFIKCIKTLKQIMIKFIPIDKNIFSFGNDENFNCFYNLFDYEKNENITEINISKLITVCQCLDNYPNIAYFSPDKYCKIIAEKVNSELKKYFSKKKNLKKNGILLITTRYIDFLAPIQFGLNYQHALLELLKKKDDKYINKVSLINNKDKTEKVIILDYKNEIYNKYKNLQISEVFKKCDEDFKSFQKSDVGKLHKLNQKKDKDKDKDKDDIDIAFALKNVSKYHYYYESYQQQINLCTEINNLMKKRNIMQLLDIQQKIISKIDEKGKKISDKDIISLIKDNKNSFNKNDLMRLLCLIKYNYPKIDLNKLITEVESKKEKFNENDKNIINSFDPKKCLKNIDVIEQLEKSIISYREKNNYGTQEEQENEYDKSCPYIKESKLTTLCDMCSKNKLPNAFFAFVEKPENLPQKNVKINLGFDQEEEDNESNYNLILFNIGGLSNFEIASMERGWGRAHWGVNLILGGNKIYNYREYFIELNNYIKGKNDIKTIIEDIPKEIEEIKKKDEEERNKEGHKVDINKIDNIKISDGKHSKEKLKRSETKNSYEEEDMK